MAMEVELDPRHRVLPFKVRAASKESQPHKAAHVVDTDPKNHWSTSTNAKEWLLLELEEPCLLQQIRIHNKSVLEWEISLGLRYKPDSFLKVRTRCEAPRRESQYTTNYAPCRYVRLSCLRGNPIAVYSVQLIGISMPGLEPEFQPLVDHLLPHVTSHKQEVQDLYLQLLREIMTRLAPFLTHLEGELAANTEGVESTLRFLAMLSGPFYPILMAIDERERMKIAAATNDLDSSKSSQASLFTVSSNFQAPPRRSRSPVPSQQSVGHLLAFRPDVALLLLKVAYKDSALGVVCRMVARVFFKLMPPLASIEPNSALVEVASGIVGQTALGSDDTVANFETAGLSYRQTDYSSLFGEEFRVLEDVGDFGVSALLDVASVEEGLLHFLYASVSKPILCRRLAEVKPDLIPVLPFIQAIVPALRPASIGIMDQPDESFMPWQAPLVQRAFSQVISLATTSSYRPLLDGCAGYLSSFSLAHEKAACIIIDLCSGPLAPWLAMVVAKVDLAFELVEGILGFIQVIDKGTARARAALVYVMIGLSGHMDESLTMYKAAKHNLIFIIEMLEPFLIPAITPIRNTIAFGDVSAVLTEKREHTCSLALDILRAAIKKQSVLPALETEWRKGHVKPSVLLSILAPQLPLPPGIDARNGVTEKLDESIPLLPPQQVTDGCLTKLMSGGMPKLLVTEEEAAAKLEPLPTDNLEDPRFFFVPAELKLLNWKILSSPPPDTQDFGQFALKGEPKTAGGDTRDTGAAEILTMDRQEEDHFLNLRVDCLQLVNFQDRELRAAEFVWFAAELHSQEDGALDNHQAAIDCLLLAAECHLNPFFMLHSIDYQQIIDKSRKNGTSIEEKLSLDRVNPRETGLNWLFCLEEERDKAVIQILLKAAEWDTEAMEKAYEDLQISEDSLLGGCSSMSGNGGICTENIIIDATTLVRKHQNLLSSFLIMQLQKERDNMYETLLQGLLFFLYSATEVSCSPEHVVDVILRTAKRLNMSLLSKPKQPKGKRSNMVSVTSLSLYRQWALLCRLVAAASGGESVEDDEEFGFSEFVYYKELVPASAWMSKIAEFSSSPLPLVRFIGWKGLARYAKSQQQTGIFLASDLQQLSSLLSVFADDLMSSGIPEAEGNTEAFDLQQQGAKHCSESTQEQLRDLSSYAKDQCSPGDAANFLYPELDLVCPSLRKQFSSSAQVILDAVCLQLRGVPATSLPDILSWFSELCCHPYVLEKKTSPQLCTKIKGYAAANVRFIILRLLEVILVEHMEAIVPELPRVLGVILSLCQSSYCDVSLLDSVLKALKPIISYGVASAASAELQIEDDPTTLTFESLCFDSLMERLRSGPDARSETKGQTSHGAFLLFLSGVVLSDLSVVRRLELMHLLMKWANFTSYSGTTSYYNYICAFQKVFEACQWLLEKSLDQRGFSLEKVAVGSKEFVEEESNVVAEMSNLAHANGDITLDSNSQEVEELHVEEILSETAQHEVKRSAAADESYGLSPRKVDNLLFSSTSDLQEFEKCIESLLFGLGAPLETVWKLHPRLAEKLTKTAAHCLMALSFLTKALCGGFPSVQTNTQHIDEVSQSLTRGRQQTLGFYGAALDAVSQAVLKFQQAHCWQVGACTMDFLLSQPTASEFFEILPSLSSALQFQCTHAPRVSWRQWTMKWLSKLITRISLDDSNAPSAPLTDLFRVLLEHREPEQRAGALQQLEKLADVEELSRGSLAEVSSSGAMWKQETLWQCREKMTKIEFFTGIVAATWDSVSSLAARDPSARIRRQAIELLVKFVPLAQPYHLQRLLSSVDAFLPGLVKATYTMSDAPVTRLSLALLSRACLYSTTKEIDTIPSRVWSSLEALSKQRPGNILAETERAMCIALLQLREQGEDANQLIHEALSRQTESQPQANMHFASVQESVLEVLARINVIRMMEDNTFGKKFQEAKDLEEAEIELELVNEEKALALEGKVGLEVPQCKTTSKSRVFPSAEASGSGMKEQFQELRAQILSEERSVIRAEILARRERQRLARHSRQLALEEWTLREVELLQELDREKAAEMERDIERHRALERERAKTRELRHSLELEAEKRTQRDLQRELEQRESGTVRPSRRDFSGSTGGSRPRERYRERESGRSGQDSRSSTGVTRENSTTPPATPTAGASISSNSSLPSIMIASSTSRAYPSQSLALSQGHDRMDDREYDEILDGVGLNGEGGSYGDMDGGGGLDPVGSGGCQRQGSRTSRPRQTVERRERESRREGKWERKQN